MKDSWDTYGSQLIAQVKVTAGQVGSLISSVWRSFENIITNGTVYSILENILKIIGNIAQAFSNAWNYNGNGDRVVQALANAFNNLLGAINNVVKSDGFQNWLKWCSDRLREISEKIESIDWQPLINALATIGESVGTVALEILSGLVGIFKWLVENPMIAEILIAIAIAIGVVSTALSIVSTVMAVLNPILATTTVTLLPLIAIILVVVAVIAALIAIGVLLVTHWDDISAWLSDTWNKLTMIFQQTWENMKECFTRLWSDICNLVQQAWQNISTFFTTIWNGIKTTAITIWDGLKNTISNALNGIKAIWDNIWNGLKNTVTNIWNGIWNAIRGVINSILGGIERMANGVINGVNSIIRVLNNLHFDIPDWVPLLGGKRFGFNINTIGSISLPRLEKGALLYEETAFVGGEYAGASNNPEIVTPQSLMEGSFEKVLSRYQGNNTGNINIENVVKLNSKILARETIQDLNDEAKRLGYKPILQRG